MANTWILEERSLAFFDDDGIYSTVVDPPVYMLVEGETYTVRWDGVEYVCTCAVANMGSISYDAIGNMGIMGGEDTGEPFLIASVTMVDATEPSYNIMGAVDTAESHTVGIALGEITEQGIVTEDWDGSKTIHSGVETVSFYNESGDEETFVHESMVATPVETTVELDFSGGDMVVTPGTGQAFSAVNIPKPANLAPENIAEGVNIAGVIGAATAGGGLADWNIFIKVATSPEVSTWEIATEEELESAGMTLYPKSDKSSQEHLKTVVVMTKLRTEIVTAEPPPTVDFRYIQNWVMTPQSGTAHCNGVLVYQTDDIRYNVTAPSPNSGFGATISGSTIRMYEGNGLTFSNAYDLYKPIGTYLFIVLQHKTARVCAALT